ncbi:MAG: GspE/PulE family protein [Candidatus Staskawiczbacteria bacterium]|jgi:type II secretory ATPase GspE/PulE/Tfp pilus assembly ATPase PilB-like protein
MYGESQKILGSVTISDEIAAQVKKEIKNISDFKKKTEAFLTQKTTDLLDVLLAGSIIIGASDIHFEAQEEQARLRVRLDGVLQDVLAIELKTYQSLISRLKLLSKIKLNITDKPQDGRFTILVEEIPVEIRTSTLPSEYGESIVMRILNPKSLIGLEALGLRKDLLETFQKEILKPNGMIIVTGPTGSGKTTTLYAFLMKIQSPDIKIITIEDPIEYHLKGVSQTQVAPEKGYDFKEGLRSIVRQDPDVILIGEIRDLETAKIALQASLTGHLVLSTLHTNDAAGTIPRLIDLGADASSIASAVTMAVAQRLVRKVCTKCSTMAKPTPEELKEIEQGLSNLPKNVKVNSIDKNFKIAKAKGCEHCNNTGYRGRKGLFEAFQIDNEIEKFILTNPPVSALRELAVKKGMVTMYQSGLIDVVAGETTLEEVKRLVEEN